MTQVKFRDAEYRGISFEILPSTSSGGQRIVTNTYPFIDEHFNEEFGDKPETFKVKGRFNGDDFRDKMQLAKRIWRVRGSGPFYEPTENKTHAVQLLDWKFNLDNKLINSVTFELSFVEKGETAYPNLLGGLFGRINGIIDTFIQTVSEVYTEVVQEAEAFTDILTAFDAAKGYLDETARLNIPSGFVAATAPITAATANRNPQTNIDTVVGIFESAADVDAPVDYFRQSSELVVNGNDVQTEQAALFARIALVYYFERVAEGASYSELESFRERAEAVREIATDDRIINAVDDLLLAAGQATTYEPMKTLDGTRNALVTAYEVYGSVDRAYEILALSGGVSGAQMTRTTYRCE